MGNLLIALLCIVLGQTISIIQLQGQFINEWMKKNTWAAVLLGLPISWLLITFTKYCKEAFSTIFLPIYKHRSNTQIPHHQSLFRVESHPY